MNPRTRTMLIIASSYFLGLVGILIWAFTTVSAQGYKMETLATLSAEQTAKEAAVQTTAQITEATTAEREQIANYFVTEADAISFLAMIEKTALGMGVKLETTELAVEPKTESAAAELKTSFRYSGKEADVLRFLQALETLPYHSRIPTLNIGIEDSMWQGSVELRVTITP
jgi:hypothetical protein